LDGYSKSLVDVRGIGPMTASAMAAAIGNGAAFNKGCDFATWLGLVPKQISTGDRTVLGDISRRGNKYLRTLFISRGPLCSPAVRRLGKKEFRPVANSSIQAIASLLRRRPTSSLASPGRCLRCCVHAERSITAVAARQKEVQELPRRGSREKNEDDGTTVFLRS
jgi:hypothetical protein